MGVPEKEEERRKLTQKKYYTTIHEGLLCTEQEIKQLNIDPKQTKN